jgi:cell division septation protein DedD
MAKYERGVYEPSDEVRVFDGSEDDEDVEGSRLPLLIVLALLVLAMFAGVVWLAYSQGVQRGRGETPVLTAAAGPARIAPQTPGGANVPYQGFKIYEQPAPPDDTAEAPAAEGPKPAPVAAPAPPAPVAVAPKPAPAPMAVAPKPAPVIAAPVPKPAPVAVKAAAKPVEAKPVAAKPTAPAKSIESLIKGTPPVSPPPAMKQAMIPAPAAATPAPVGGPATGAPRTLGAPVKPAPVGTAAPASTGGAYVLQIGAYKSQADADTAWKSYKAKHAALLSGFSPDVKQADLGEKGTWYRLRIGGLSDKDGASALCDRLKADGGACLLGK